MLRTKQQKQDAERMRSSVHRGVGGGGGVPFLLPTTRSSSKRRKSSLLMASSIINVESEDEPIHISQGNIPLTDDLFPDDNNDANKTGNPPYEQRSSILRGNESVQDTWQEEQGSKGRSGSGSMEVSLPFCLIIGLALTMITLGAAGTTLGIFNLIQGQKETNNGSERINNNNNGNPNDNDNNNKNQISTLERILQRGYINCGSGPADLPGMLLEASPGTYTGMEHDLCVILASALFNGNVVNDDDGDPNNGQPRYRIIPLSYADRWQVLAGMKTIGTDDDTDNEETNNNDNNGEPPEPDIDVLFRSTYTMERDLHEPSAQQGFEFSFPYFLDGLALGGLPDSLACAEKLDFNSTQVCQDVRVCVLQGTTHEAVMKKILPDNIIIWVNQDQEGFPDRCNVMASETQGINSEAVKLKGYNGPYQLGTRRFSREPISLVTRQGDARWSDFVEWIIQGLIYAEEEDITQPKSSAFDSTYVFGGNASHPHPTLEQMFRHANQVRGNYGELYNLNVESFIQRNGMNRLNTGDSPIIFSFPFGDTAVEGAQIEIASPTVRAIKARGYLSCGVSLRKGFAEFDGTTWTGFDVELCRAIAAALFDGVDHVRYTDLPAAQRFLALQDGLVDVLARLTTWTLARDVKEPTTGIGLSFSSPYFHDGLKFGGLGAHTQCCDNLDVISPECQDLKICVLQGTTILSRVQELFWESYIDARLNFNDIIAGLNDGSCNAVAGGFHDVALQSIEERGYVGDEIYTVGENLFSKDPLALTTLQSDPLWSDFVRWIFWALVYGEENGISQETASDMPRTKLFGPLRTNALYHALNAVGNFGELYHRNFEGLVPRGGLHELNIEFGPMLRALPGIALK